MTRVRLDKLFALTRGASVLAVPMMALPMMVAGCDRAGAGDAPVTATIPASTASATSSSSATPEPQASAPVIAAAVDDASDVAIHTRRIPIPNAMPRRVVADDASQSSKKKPSVSPEY